MIARLSPLPETPLRPRRAGARPVARRAGRLWQLVAQLLLALVVGLAPAPVVAMTLIAPDAPSEQEAPHETEGERLDVRADLQARARVAEPRWYTLARGYDPRLAPVAEPLAARWIVPPQRKTLLHLLH